MDNLTRQISDFAASLSFDALPAKVVETTKQRLVDSLACAVGGRMCESAQMGMRISEGAVPKKYAGRILSFPQRTTAESAAFINGAMIRYLDFNDLIAGWGHPSDCVGGLFALAESVGADGKRLIASVNVAYDVAMRLGASSRLRKLGWDQGFWMAVGTAAGVGNLLRLPADKIAHAVALAAVANVTLRASRAGKLSLWKGAATPHASRSALSCALLAAEGMTGPDRPFEGKSGLWEQITGPFEIDPFPTEGGEFWVLKTHLKFWPVEGNAQIVIDAARQLREKMKPEQIAGIEIGTNWVALSEIGSDPEKWNPKTRETADHSMPYIFARSLVDGGISLRSFEPKSYLDPSLRPLMNKIKIHQDDRVNAMFPATIAIDIDVTGTDGGTMKIALENPRGHDKNPMSNSETDEKFHALADPVLGDKGTRVALDAWWQIETAPQLTKAFDLLNPAAKS